MSICYTNLPGYNKPRLEWTESYYTYWKKYYFVLVVWRLHEEFLDNLVQRGRESNCQRFQI